ncbi:MAG: hypothetical protein [aquatic viral metagenome]
MITAIRADMISASEAQTRSGVSGFNNLQNVGEVTMNIYGLPGVSSIEEYSVSVSINGQSYGFNLRDLILNTKNGTAILKQVTNGNSLIVAASESALENTFGDSDIDVQCYHIFVGYTGQGTVTVEAQSNMRLLGEVGPESLGASVSLYFGQNCASVKNIPSNIILTLQNLFYLIAYVELIIAVFMLIYLLYIRRTGPAVVYFIVDYLILGLLSLNNGYATVVAVLAAGVLEYKQYKEVKGGTYRYGMGIVVR